MLLDLLIRFWVIDFVCLLDSRGLDTSLRASNDDVVAIDLDCFVSRYAFSCNDESFCGFFATHFVLRSE